MGRRDRNPLWREANIWEKPEPEPEPPRRYSTWATTTTLRASTWGTNHDVEPDIDLEARTQEQWQEPEEHEEEELEVDVQDEKKKTKKRSIWRSLACGMKFPKMGWSFGRKKNKEGSAADSNPYAQQPAADPYAHQYASPAQSQATLSSTTSSGPRPGGLPSGPAPYHNNQAPPPYSAGGPVQQPPAAGRYTNERFGTTDRYGDNRYDTASTSNYNRYEPSIDSKQSQLYNSSRYSSNASASTSAQPSPVKQHYPVQYGDNKQPGQLLPDGPQEYQPTPQEIYGNKFGVPEEELDEEQKQELEVDRTKNEIMRTHQENLESLDRTNQHLDNILALAGNAVEMTARQGESLDRVELNSIQAIRKAEKAGDTTKYLGKLNSRPFFVPAVSRKGLREMDEKTIMDESMEKMERHKARAAQYQGRQAVEGLLPGQRKGLLGAKASKKYDAFEVDDEARSKFTFEDDDGQQEAMLKQQFEREKNLMMKMEQVHGISVGLGHAIERQNHQVERITENHERTDGKLVRTRVQLDAMLR